ncbi:MAG: zinc finger domain-containing protein [Candidatus Aenigmatarchaeota archaeon]
MKCSSCHIVVNTEEGFSKFDCPKCSNFEIIRCKTCRKRSKEYRCQKCGFVGP